MHTALFILFVTVCSANVLIPPTELGCQEHRTTAEFFQSRKDLDAMLSSRDLPKATVLDVKAGIFRKVLQKRRVKRAVVEQLDGFDVELR